MHTDIDNVKQWWVLARDITTKAQEYDKNNVSPANCFLMGVRSAYSFLSEMSPAELCAHVHKTNAEWEYVETELKQKYES